MTEHRPVQRGPIPLDSFARGLLEATGLNSGTVTDAATSLQDDLCFDSFHILELIGYIDELVNSNEPPFDPVALATVGDAYDYYVALLASLAR